MCWRTGSVGVANNFYMAKDPWTWICLRIDPALLTSEVPLQHTPERSMGACHMHLPAAECHAQVKFEPAAPVGSIPPPAVWCKGRAEESPPQPLFPHLYGTIDFPAVLQEHAVLRDADSGKFLKVEGVAAA